MHGKAMMMVLGAVGISVTAAAADPARHPFTFHGVEFVSADQRSLMAQQFIATHAAVGTSLSAAIAAMRRANAPCRRKPQSDGSIVCRYSRPVSSSADDMLLGDVTWTVRLYPGARQDVARATVSREVRGL